VGLSWYQLYVRDFAGALASTDAGKKLDDSNLYLDTNRSHALLFLGRTQEAQAIYLGNRGKKLDPKQEQTWDMAILKDFDELEEAGLTNPELSQIRRLLSPDQK
jgi:lipoprotein NlpI